MPITYRIDEENGVVFTTGSGVLTEAELLLHKKKVIADPRFKPGFVELSDVRSIADLEITASGLERFVAQDDSDADRLKGFRLAIVVSGALEFGMGAMYEMMSRENNRDVRIFRDLSLARDWLQLPK